MQKRAICAICVLCFTALPLAALSDTIRPKPRPDVHQIKLEDVVPVASRTGGSQMTLLLIQASSFVSAAGMITGTPLIPLLPK